MKECSIGVLLMSSTGNIFIVLPPTQIGFPTLFFKYNMYFPIIQSLFFPLFRRKIKDKQVTNNGRQAPPAVLMFRKEESRYGLICTSNFKRKYFPGYDRK